MEVYSRNHALKIDSFKYTNRTTTNHKQAPSTTKLQDDPELPFFMFYFIFIILEVLE